MSASDRRGCRVVGAPTNNENRAKKIARLTRTEDPKYTDVAGRRVPPGDEQQPILLHRVAVWADLSRRPGDHVQNRFQLRHPPP